MKKCCVVIVSLLVSLSFSPVSAETRGITDDLVKMGQINADTGPIAQDSQSITKGIQNYIRHLNELGGVNGRRIRIIAEDSGYSIPRALSAFKKLLYKDKVFTFFGPASTGEATALFPRIAKERVVTIPLSGSETMARPHKRYVFGFTLTYQDAIKILFDYAIKNQKPKKPKMAIVYPDVEFGKVGMKEARRQAKIYGVQLHEEILNMGSLEATSQVLSMKRYQPDYVILQHVIAPAAIFMREARKFGLKTNFLGTLTDTNLDTVRMAKEAARGYRGVNCLRSWYEDMPGVEKMRRITLGFHPGTEKPYRSKYYTAGWIMGMLFTEGMKRAGRDLDNETLVKALESIRDYDAWGLTGPITYGLDDHKGQEYGILYEADLKNGIVRAFADWRRPLHP